MKALPAVLGICVVAVGVFAHANATVPLASFQLDIATDNNNANITLVGTRSSQGRSK